MSHAELMQQGIHARIQFDVFSLSAPICLSPVCSPYDIVVPMWNLSVTPTETPHNWIPTHGIEFPMTSKLIGLESEVKGKNTDKFIRPANQARPILLCRLLSGRGELSMDEKAY